MNLPVLPAFDPVAALSHELALPRHGVAAVVELLQGGATVPFIARYRKEATGGLDEVQIRTIDERRTYLRELHERKQAVLDTIAGQGKLTDSLARSIIAATTKAVVEDLFAPYRTRRRTRAVIARENGLQPLADLIGAQPPVFDPASAAAPFVNEQVADIAAAIAGARDILAEEITDRADIRGMTRQRMMQHGVLVVEATDAARATRTKFEQYYDFSEPLASIPSHRFLAVRRGEKEGMLRTNVVLNPDALRADIEALLPLVPTSPAAGLVSEAIADGIKRLLLPSVESDTRVDLKLQSDIEAVTVFAENLRALLLAAPAGEITVVGVDPGLRTGCKCAALDATGQFRDTITFNILGNDTSRSERDLASYLRRHRPFAVAIGNGTGGRETEQFVRKVMATLDDPRPIVVPVNEAGASVYSASDVAREEFPELDLTIRGAISIARRLQDPLAELVKIDPKSIGVGQYQHDVHQPLLQRKLSEVVESCVNHVGVEINTASASLLSYVAGIGESTARRIIEFRNAHGAFTARSQLLKVPGIGPRTFEQCAGFIRVRSSQQPLDSSAVHPERYGLVERMAADMGVSVAELVGSESLARRIPITRYVGADVGEPTLRDIIDELCKPGRDPRQAFEPPKFRDDVQTMDDVQPGMVLEGVVTNVTAFGAFVDIGVHQDGLVHVSHLSEKFVRNPAEVVKAGDRLTVRVLEVDKERKRISLTARLSDEAPRPARTAESGGPTGRSEQRPAPAGGDRNRQPAGRPSPKPAPQRKEEFAHTPFASLLKK